MAGGGGQLEQCRFLNVDVELRSDKGISQLLTAFQKDVIVLRNEAALGLLVFELSNIEPRTIDEALHGYRELVTRLNPKDRAIWDGCRSRVFDIGIEVGTTARAEEFEISESAVRAVHDLRGAFKITVYRP
ncbi:MAG: hypothetical protein KDJ36_12315 [Hyphomicrobiaceae bacterium]|nr:hypothetical protein [Hyphomicrobiaceae bacterium]